MNFLAKIRGSVRCCANCKSCRSIQCEPYLASRMVLMRAEWMRGRSWFDILRAHAVLLLLTVLVSTAVLSKVIQYYSFRIDDFDTGIYSNLIWHLANGSWFYSDVLSRNHLGEHFSPIIAV